VRGAKPMNTQHIFYHLQVIFLPLMLAFLFAVQNQVFNIWLHLFSTAYSTRLLFASFALGLILYSPSLFFHRRGRYLYLFFISLLISFLFIAQFIYFEAGQSFVQVSALRYIGQAFAISGTAKTFLSFKLLVFVLQLFFVAGAYLFSKSAHYAEILVSKKEKIFLFFLLIIVAFAGYRYLLGEEKKEWGNTSRLYTDVYDLNTLVAKVGIVNFTFEDAIKYVLRSNLVTSTDKNFLKNFAKSQPALKKEIAGKNVATPNYFGIDKNKNVIIIQIESLENAVINQTVAGQEITPTLNQLAQQGLYFSNYYTQIGPGNTADAEFSTTNSLYPLSDDVVFVDYAQNQYNALPKLLVKNGYHTYALHGDVPTFWNRSNIYPNLGYQTQISEPDYIISRPIGHGPSPLGDEDFFSQSIPKMKQFKQPFLSTLITLSSHTPFILPQDLQTLPIPADTNLDPTQQQYLESIHYMDTALGEFIGGLKSSGLYDNSVIFIYGDHESFTNISQALSVGDNNLPALAASQVPLIILNSGIAPAQITTPASHLDFYPTVVNLLGFKPLQSVLGQDVFNTKTPVVTRRNIFSGTINTILTNTLAFKANADGVFGHGECLKEPEETPLPTESCQSIYNQQTNTIRASDIIVRGNLLDYYIANLPR